MCGTDSSGSKEIMVTLAERTIHKHLFNVGTGICTCLIELFVVSSEQVMSGGEPPVLTSIQSNSAMNWMEASDSLSAKMCCEKCRSLLGSATLD